MKYKLKQAILKRLLSPKQIKRMHAPEIMFPGIIHPINMSQNKDIFVVGYPKSGNTLMQHILTHLVYGINGQVSRSMVNLIVPDIYANSHYFRFNDVCFFKSHNLPEKRYKRVIYIVRDGRNTLLSYYHMINSLGKSVSLEDLYKGNIKLFNTLWHEHIQQWEANPYDAEILFVRYEDLVLFKKDTLKEICSFLNITRSEEELNQVIQHTSLNQMKELEQKEDWKFMKEKVNFEKKKSFVRTGATKLEKGEVPKELLESFEALSKEYMIKYGYL